MQLPSNPIPGNPCMSARHSFLQTIPQPHPTLAGYDNGWTGNTRDPGNLGPVQALRKEKLIKKTTINDTG